MIRHLLRRLGVTFRRDEGQISAGMAGTFLLLILLSGLLLDPGLTLAAQIRALDIAQSAARAGADHLDVAALRTSGVIRLDPDAAAAAARDFLRSAGAPGTVAATTTEVSVTIRTAQPTRLLSLVGIGTLPVSATATARPATGP